MMCRAAAWLVIVLALITQVVTVAAGPGAQICVCSSGVSIEHQGKPCCVGEKDDQGGDPKPAAPSGCPNCHLIPLPDAVVASEPMAPIVLPAAILPTVPVLMTVIAWPSVVRSSARYGQEHPPPHLHLRRLRTVVITC